MRKTSYFLFCGLIILVVMITGCSKKDPKDVKRTVVGETESITVAKAFLGDILAYNQENDKDLTHIEEYTAFWDYLKGKGLTQNLSSTILDATHYGDSEWRTIDAFYSEQVKPLINYLYGYQLEDFTYSFDESLGNIDVHIKPETIDKGIYLLNDPAEAAFQIFVERVAKEGIKVVSVYTELPKALENKHLWVAKDQLDPYLSQIKTRLAEQDKELEKQKQEEAAQAALDASLQAEQEEEQKKLEQAQQEQEQNERNEAQCSVETQYEDKVVRFLYDGCTAVTGKLELDNEMNITREARENDLLGDSFTIEIKAKANSDHLAFSDYDDDKYDFEYSSLFGEYGFVNKTTTSSSGETSEYYEGIVAGGERIVMVTLRYAGETRPARADTLLFTSLKFQ
ncbi:hypothetical protein [Gorillibacterium sp. CAU 1737]|uniref:hypothetical protein n=1 Tax=Gorillibacterium sp. CAU 1737 TaxID=3140362 RepID=UPI003260E623